MLISLTDAVCAVLYALQAQYTMSETKRQIDHAAVAALAAMYAAASKQLHQYSLRPLGLFQLTEGIGKGYFHTGTPFGSF